MRLRLARCTAWVKRWSKAMDFLQTISKQISSYHATLTIICSPQKWRSCYIILSCLDSYGLISGKSWSWTIIWLKKCCHQGRSNKNKFISWYSLLCVWGNWTWMLVLNQASKEFVEKEKIPTWGVLRTNKGLPISKSEKTSQYSTSWISICPFT